MDEPTHHSLELIEQIIVFQRNEVQISASKTKHARGLKYFWLKRSLSSGFDSAKKEIPAARGDLGRDAGDAISREARVSLVDPGGKRH
jgi:hypothetical protein